MYQKASQKVSTLSWIADFTDFKQNRSIIKKLIESQFGYYPLLRMFHSGGLNNKRNCIHENIRILKYKGKSSTLQERLEKDNSVSIHHKNIQNLTIEI